MAESIGRELLVYGRRIPKAELFARIDAVDAPTIRAVADRFIYDQVGLEGGLEHFLGSGEARELSAGKAQGWVGSDVDVGVGGVWVEEALFNLLLFTLALTPTTCPPSMPAQDMAVASVGDVQFMPDYNFFRRRSYWLRY